MALRTTTRCDDCQSDYTIFINEPEVPRQGTPYKIYCEVCKKEKVFLVDAVDIIPSGCRLMQCGLSVLIVNQKKGSYRLAYLTSLHRLTRRKMRKRGLDEMENL